MALPIRMHLSIVEGVGSVAPEIAFDILPMSVAASVIHASTCDSKRI